MLVLARRINERIIIAGDIVITVLEVGRGGQVRLGITAPASVQIHREEVIERRVQAPATAIVSEPEV